MAMLFKKTLSGAKIQQSFKIPSVYSLRNGALNLRKFSNEVSTKDEISLPVETEDAQLFNQNKEKLIEAKRNVSRLRTDHRNLVHGNVPYPEPKADYHMTVKYRKKMYGKYGSSSGVNPGIMWPTKEDIKERKEYEAVAYPFTIQEMVQAEVSKQEAEEAEIIERQKKIQENMKKLNQWMKDLEIRRAKKISVAAEAKSKKDKLIEEVRRHFGYTVDHRDEKFQLMLEQKEKEERKVAKLEKKKKREESMLQDLMLQAQKEENKK